MHQNCRMFAFMLSDTSYIQIDIEDSPFQELDDALSYWNDRKLGCEFPSWKNIDLIELHPKLIPRICVVDVENAPLDFKYRFWGSEITNMHKLDFTGRSILEVPPAKYAEILFQQYEAVTVSKAPKIFVNRFENENGYRSQYAVVRMPLSSSTEGQIGHILSAETYGEDFQSLSKLFEVFANRDDTND